MKTEMGKNFFNELESKSSDKENKEYFFFENDSFVTYKFKIDKYKLNKYINKLVEMYSTTSTKTYLNVDVSEYVIKNPVSNNGNIILSYSNIQKHVEEIKTGLFHKKEEITYTADREVAAYEKPFFIKVIRNIENRKYLNLVDLYNYLLVYKGYNRAHIQCSYGSNPKVKNMGYTDLSIRLNEKEINLIEEEVNNLLNGLFSCFIDIKKEEIAINNNTIAVDLNSSYEDLINLKSKLNIAKKNTEILNDNLLEISLSKKVRIR